MPIVVSRWSVRNYVIIGMRQLLEEKMNELVVFINSLMRDSTVNPFQYVSATSARILSGEEEGVFAWITVNYLLGSFAGQSVCRSLPRADSRRQDFVFGQLCLFVLQFATLRENG